MISEHELVVRSLVKDDFDSEDLFNDKKATKQIELHLQSIEFNSTGTWSEGGVAQLTPHL